MKKVVLLICLSANILSAQYFGERTTEQSFESSSLFFNSHFLNTYGIYKFKDAAVGLIDDPFLNSYLNPAFLPDIGSKEFLIHLDFRGDKTKPEVIKSYVQPLDYLASSSYIDTYLDPRWFSETRKEPEPVVSLGFLMYPDGLSDRNLYIGGSYQLILADENFYELPYSIYNKNIYYDAFNSRIAEDAIYIDHSTSTNEMLNEAHLLSLFSGYKFSDQLSAGIFINSVMHSRDGAIGNDGLYFTYPYSNSILSQREQNYDHFDFGTGINYNPTERFLIGLKIGLLIGSADQNFLSESNFYNKSNEPDVSDDWDYNYSAYTKDQTWQQDGNTFYAGFNIKKQFVTGSTINLYYRFTGTDITTTTSSVINDTSNYSNRWYNSYDQAYQLSKSSASLHDSRFGSGTRNNYRHEFMFNLNWQVAEIFSIYSALYIKRDKYSIYSFEPVRVTRTSTSYCEGYPEDLITSNNTYSYEEKNISWDYEAKTWTLQIPVLLNVEVNKYWGFMAGINRILDAWNVDDVTTADVKYRYHLRNGSETTESNIRERFRQPDKRITEDKFDFIASVHSNISNELHLRLMLNPEFENDFSIDQWWLSFNAGF